MYLIMNKITSRENKLIKYAAKLQNKSFRDSEKAFVIEGEKLFLEAVRFGVELKSIFVSDEYSISSLPKLPKGYENITYICPMDIIKKISQTATPEGIVVIVHQFKIHDVNEIKQGRFLALENMSDPQNTGAIIRGAHAFGLSGIILTRSSADVFSFKTIRASMGSCFTLPIYLTDSINCLITTIGKGFKFYAAALDDNATELENADFGDSSVVVIGNESKGITKETMELCETLYINMQGTAQSLNAAVAAGIIAYKMSVKSPY